MLRLFALFATALESLAAPTIGRTQLAPPEAAANCLDGTSALDGRTAYGAAPAWIFSADGSHSEVVLPDLPPWTRDRWHQRGGSIFYALAQAGELPRRAAPLNKRMNIVVRAPDRLVAIGGRCATCNPSLQITGAL